MRSWSSEADVGAEFYHQMRLKGRFEVYLEVPLPSAHHRSGKFRADAVVCLGDRLVCAVEFKKASKPSILSGRQANAYRDIGMIYLVCNGVDRVPWAVELIHERSDDWELWGQAAHI